MSSKRPDGALLHSDKYLNVLLSWLAFQAMAVAKSLRTLGIRKSFGALVPARGGPPVPLPNQITMAIRTQLPVGWAKEKHQRNISLV